MTHAAIIQTVGDPMGHEPQGPTSLDAQVQVYPLISQPLEDDAGFIVNRTVLQRPILKIQHEMADLGLPLGETEFGKRLYDKIKGSLKDAKHRRRETTEAQGRYEDWADSLKSELKLLKPSPQFLPKKRHDDRR